MTSASLRLTDPVVATAEAGLLERDAGTVRPGVDLTIDRGVDRRMVHRSSISEVFVTDATRTGPDSFVVAGQLPRGHTMLETPSYDFNILLEFVRQAGVYLSHREYDVPVGDTAFVFRRLAVEMASEILTVGPRPAEALAALTCDGRVNAVSFRGDLSVDGRYVLTGHGQLLVMTTSAWTALRSRGRRQAVEAALPLVVRRLPAAARSIGRVDLRNVVISETTPVVSDSGAASRTWLVVNTTHPYLFDHELDHLPGNLILEGARQAAVATAAQALGLDPFAMAVYSCVGDFDGFGELDVATSLHASCGEINLHAELQVPACPVTVTVHQGATTIAEVRLVLAVQP